MAQTIDGIHHVTAIARDPQLNINFYAGVLGLRLVKLTVNFDDPGSYHLYYGDALGHPGTILTFFAWPHGLGGHKGTGAANVIAFTIPAASRDFWAARLDAHGILHHAGGDGFSGSLLTFEDPDGIEIALVPVAGAEATPVERWRGEPVDASHAIRGFHHVTLWEEDARPTARLLIESFGFREVGMAGDFIRYHSASDADGPGTFVDVRTVTGHAEARIAVGSVHHVAWRTPTDAEQLAWRERLHGQGLHTTKVLDRQYFHSIYFREPGGVLFEIATDPPGFAVDEAPDKLGTHLKLPPWLEPDRAGIEAELPPLRLPGSR
ncbi:MAG TPA: ring-cleaving dioxygenase [Ktedonobacterales bacterium]